MSDLHVREHLESLASVRQRAKRVVLQTIDSLQLQTQSVELQVRMVVKRQELGFEDSG